MEGRHPTLASIRLIQFGPQILLGKSIGQRWMICALAERDAVVPNNALIAFGENPIALSSENVHFNRPFVEGVIARMTTRKSKRDLLSLLPARSRKKSSKPNQITVPRCASLVNRRWSRPERGSASRRSARGQLLPVEKDAPEGVDMVKYSAMMARRVVTRISPANSLP